LFLKIYDNINRLRNTKNMAGISVNARPEITHVTGTTIIFIARNRGGYFNSGNVLVITFEVINIIKTRNTRLTTLIAGGLRWVKGMSDQWII